MDSLTYECDLTIGVTCYNEAQYIVDTIKALVEAVESTGRSYEVIVIDDCSKDDSAKRVREYLAANADKPVRLVVNEKNRGLSNNFMDAAFMGKGRHFRLSCGDNPETVDALKHIFSHIDTADMVIPYQIQGDVAGKSMARRNISRLYTLLVNMLSGNNILYYNSLPILPRYYVLRYPPVSYGFGFQADLVTRLLEQGITYAQIRHRGVVDRKGAKSTSISMRNLLSVIHTFVEITIRRLRRVLYGKGMPRAREIRIED